MNNHCCKLKQKKKSSNLKLFYDPLSHHVQLVGFGGGEEGGASRPCWAWGGGLGGGSEGASGISLILGPVSFFLVFPGPHAREGAFHDSPFKAA